MASTEGGNIVVNKSVSGSLFPTSEKDIAFPVLIDGRKSAIHIEGSVYGRSIEIRSDVTIDGPVVSRGDTRLSPDKGKIQLNGGLTVNGILNGVAGDASGTTRLTTDIQQASIIVKGDIAVNQSLFLANAIVFGSIKAVNCKLQSCIVLGTLVVDESLTVSMSSIGGYSAAEVHFEGDCVMLHALGESRQPPVFSPCELPDGQVIDCDVRYYPAMRERSRLVNLRHTGMEYPSYSRLEPRSDWVRVMTRDPQVPEHEPPAEKTVLSIGGRIGDFARIHESIKALTRLLKCGFEYDHLHLSLRDRVKNDVMAELTPDEAWILDKVCV